MKSIEGMTLAKEAMRAADDKKGIEISGLDVRGVSSVVDAYVFVGGNSHTHVRALEDAVRTSLSKKGGRLIRVDGQRGHLWRVLDYGNLIVHILEQKLREFYSLERLWNQGKPISLGKKATSPKPVRKRAKKTSRKKTSPKKSKKK